MTTLLAFDTTLGACSVALFENDKLLFDKKEVRARGHVERLLPMVDDAIKASGKKMADLTHIAITTGPGTFAGVRIGLSAAKGMAMALNIPLIPVTTLEAIAFDFAKKEKNFTGNIVVAVDARRGELYFQIFNILEQNIYPVTDAQAVPIKSVASIIDDSIKMVIGSGASIIGSLIIEQNIGVSENFQNPSAVIIGEFALKHKERMIECDKVKPFYLRAPDAILPSKNLTPKIKHD